MMNEIIYNKSYEEYRAEIEGALTRAAESFVRIGYLLKVARDTNILKDSPYNNVNDFAWSVYGMDKTMVSRFININDRFSESGYSEKLQEQYRGYGYAKLSLMLRLPDVLIEDITPELSKTEINTIKQEYDKESAITPLEVVAENKSDRLEELDSNMSRAFFQLLHDNPELYARLHAADISGWRDVREIAAPSGSAVYIFRIAGVGRIMMSFRENDVAVTNMRDESRETCDGIQAVGLIEAFIDRDLTLKKSWNAAYGEEWPEKEHKTRTEATGRKTPKVMAASPAEHKAEQKADKLSEEKAKPEDSKGEAEEHCEEKAEEQVNNCAGAGEEHGEQIEGQASVYDYPELMPVTQAGSAAGLADNYPEITKEIDSMLNLWNQTGVSRTEVIELMIEIIDDLKNMLLKVREMDC